MSAAIHAEPYEPYDPHQRLGEIQVDPAPTPPEPLESAPPRREHAMTIRVYDWCPEYGFHTDPGLTGTAEGL